MPAYGAHIPVRHPNGVTITVVVEDDDLVVGLDLIDLALTKLAERGYTLGAEDDDLEEGEKIETALSYVVGKTKAGEPAIWLYHFPRTLKTGVLYKEQIELWPFPIDYSKPWPVATAPDYVEAKAAGCLRDLPQMAKFVRKPTGEKTAEGKPVTKFDRMIAPKKLPGVTHAAAPPAPAIPQHRQPPPAATSTPPPPPPEDEHFAWPRPEPVTMPAQSKAMRDAFIATCRQLFDSVPHPSEQFEDAMAWFCQKYTYQKSGNDLAKAHRDINMLTDADLQNMIDTATQHADKVRASFKTYTAAMTPPRI